MKSDGNHIAQDQNSERSLKLQMAKEHLYALASRVQLTQGLIPAANAAVWLIVLPLKPDLRVWSVLLAFLIPIVDLILLDPLQKKWKLIAAKVQELFDCDVLHLPWNGFKIGERPTEETIAEHARKYRRKQMTNAHLPDWYTFQFEDLPYQAATVICQRSNCWWDSQLRRTYSWILLSSVSVIGISCVVYGIVAKASVEQFVLALIAPISPFIMWAVKESRLQEATATNSERVLASVNQVWTNVCEKQKGVQTLDHDSRMLQDEIFARRSVAPVNPSWLYFFKRNDYQKLMVEGGQQLIERYRRSRNVPGRQRT